MSWEILLDKDVQAFMSEHEGDDVSALALKKPPNKDWPYPVILDQVKVRQKACLKTPGLRDTKGFVFPPPFLYEQASSEACANYKALITKSISGDSFVDLTAGCGVDAFALAENFSRGVLVEKNSRNADLLAHNAQITGQNLEVKHDAAEAYVKSLLDNDNKVSLVYVDPQRREDVGGKKGFFDFELCSPNILALLPDLAKVAEAVLIKTAPFLDIDKAVEQIENCFSKLPHINVHVVQWRGDCKEVLYLIDFTKPEREGGVFITAVDLGDDGAVKSSFSFSRQEERDADVKYAMPEVGDYIYEPGPAFQKAGCFKRMSEYFCMAKLHVNTQLYVHNESESNFPGKKYQIIGVFPFKSAGLPIKRADLVVRNFPQSVAKLKKKLKLQDGGVHRLYATTTYDDKHCLILCKK